MDWWLDHMSWERRADRWSVDLWGDRWVVSDFWFDHLFQVGRVQLESDEQWQAFKDRFREARSRIIEPTFVAIDTGAREDLVQFERDYPSEDHPGMGVPLLRLDNKDEGVMAEEILAACQAARGLTINNGPVVVRTGEAL